MSAVSVYATYATYATLGVGGLCRRVNVYVTLRALGGEKF